jgi:dolichyl-phosphate-mannose--protein O-mannosyl transferase
MYKFVFGNWWVTLDNYTTQIVYLHDLILELHSGPGDGFFSSAFQSTLHGNELFKTSLPEREYQYPTLS